ncbi:MAG: riboflavin synthase [Patescibacteria group bacterium]
MFTGIISRTTKVKNVKPAKGGLSLELENNFFKLKSGESISVNGVCSTVKRAGKNLSLEYMPETLKLSNLGFLKKNDTINTEQSMKLSDKLNGHIVLGHVDGKGKILNITKEGNSKVFEITIPAEKFLKFLVYKGSIAVEGVSLTVAKVLRNSFIVKIIPYTLKHTNFEYKKRGDFLNLEFDILAKYAHANKK